MWEGIFAEERWKDFLARVVDNAKKTAFSTQQSRFAYKPTVIVTVCIRVC